MQLAVPEQVLALAVFLRERLGEVGEVLAPLLRRGGEAGESQDVAAPFVVVAPSPPFALTPQARARLLRQAHACGLLGAPAIPVRAELPPAP